MFKRLAFVFAALVPVSLFAAEPEPAPAPPPISTVPVVAPVPATEPPVSPMPPVAPMPPPVVLPPALPPPPPTFGFDVVQSPWGPGRKSSGEGFKSSALLAPEGPARFRWKDYSLSIGGQYFARGELRDNEDFNTKAGDHTLGIDQRARLTVRASAKDRVGVYLEVQDVRAWGGEASTVVGAVPAAAGAAQAFEGSTGFHQAFVDYKAASFFDLRIGRQELAYGEDRLIGNLDWGQVARSFDGVFARFTYSPQFTVDVFGMMTKPPAWLQVQLTPATAPEGATFGPRFHNSGSYFTGVYARARFGKAGVDVYGLGLLEDPSAGGLGGVGFKQDNNRLTVGARAFVNISTLAMVGEGAYQAGKMTNGDAVSAGAVAFKATYTLSSVFGSPYIMGEFSAATGDGDGTDGKDNTFNQLFPTAHVHLGYMDYVAWQNVLAGRGTIGIRPWGTHIWLDVHHFAAWDPRGIWYRASGAQFLQADPTRTNGNMGTEVDLSVTVPLFENISLAGNISAFVPGLEAKAKGQSVSTWGFLYVRAQF